MMLVDGLTIGVAPTPTPVERRQVDCDALRCVAAPVVDLGVGGGGGGCCAGVPVVPTPTSVRAGEARCAACVPTLTAVDTVGVQGEGAQAIPTPTLVDTVDSGETSTVEGGTSGGECVLKKRVSRKTLGSKLVAAASMSILFKSKSILRPNKHS